MTINFNICGNETLKTNMDSNSITSGNAPSPMLTDADSETMESLVPMPEGFQEETQTLQHENQIPSPEHFENSHDATHSFLPAPELEEASEIQQITDILPEPTELEEVETKTRKKTTSTRTSTKEK